MGYSSLQFSPFCGCVFNCDLFEDIYLILIDYADNGDAVFIIGTKSPEITCLDIKANIKKGDHLNLMAYTRFEMPCDGLYLFKIYGFISSDILLKAANLSRTFLLDHASFINEVKTSNAEEYIENIFFLRSKIIEHAIHAPMAVPENTRIEDFNEIELNIISNKHIFYFSWYPDQNKKLKLEINENKNNSSIIQTVNDAPCLDSLFINGENYNPNLNGEIKIPEHQVNYLIEFFSLYIDGNLKLKSFNKSYSEMLKDRVISIFDGWLQEPAYAFASSREIQRNINIGNGSLIIKLNDNMSGIIESLLDNPNCVAIYFSYSDDNDQETTVHVGIVGESAGDFILVERLCQKQFWLDSTPDKLDKIKIKVYGV